MRKTKTASGVYGHVVAKKAFRSLRTSPGFTAFVLDQLAGLGEVTTKSMFGGVGLYRGDLFFGIVARDVLYLKVDDETRASFERIGSRPFRPYPDRPASMQYYGVPLAVLEDADDLLRRARGAVAAAERARDKKGRSGSITLRPARRRPD